MDVDYYAPVALDIPFQDVLCVMHELMPVMRELAPADGTQVPTFEIREGPSEARKEIARVDGFDGRAKDLRPGDLPAQP